LDADGSGPLDSTQAALASQISMGRSDISGHEIAVLIKSVVKIVCKERSAQPTMAFVARNNTEGATRQPKPV
jgi:hypothetical protein